MSRIEIVADCLECGLRIAGVDSKWVLDVVENLSEGGEGYGASKFHCSQNCHVANLGQRLTGDLAPVIFPCVSLRATRRRGGVSWR